MLRLALGDYAATPNVSLFLGKSVTTDKPSPHMIDLNNSRVARLILLGDTKAITGNVGYIKTISSNCVCGIYYRLSIPMIN